MFRSSMLCTKISSLVLLGVLSIASARAASIDEGKAAYLAKEYDKAFQILEPLAQQGDPQAQMLLGVMYDYGQGVPESDSEAVVWYEKAARQGTPSVQHNLGAKYYTGIGIPRDYAKALSWWRLAAERGLAESQYGLGLLYAQGLGTAKDLSKAAAWFHRAAKQDHAEAQYEFARLLESGAATASDKQAAIVWYQRATDLGLQKAKQRLVRLEHSTEISHHEAAAGANAIKPKPQPAPSSETSVSSTTAIGTVDARINREDWVRAQDPAHYTVQLVTMSNEQGLIDLLHKHALQSDVAYFQRDLHGKVAYTAIYGVFESSEAARAAIAALPPVIQQGRPIVRKLSAVQALIPTLSGPTRATNIAR